MRRTILRIARIAGGVACLVLGVAGLFLPFVQGILLLIVGLTLLSSESERACRWSDWLRSQVHRTHTVQLGEQNDGRG